MNPLMFSPSRRLSGVQTPAQTPSRFSRLLVAAFFAASSFLGVHSSVVAQEAESSKHSGNTSLPLAAYSNNAPRANSESTAPVQQKAILPESTQYTYVPASINKTDLTKHLQYPMPALLQGREAQIDVIAYLNAEGSIMSLNFVKDASNIEENEFTLAAFDAVKKCRFTPAYRDNKPVNSIVKIPIRFVQ